MDRLVSLFFTEIFTDLNPNVSSLRLDFIWVKLQLLVFKHPNPNVLEVWLLLSNEKKGCKTRFSQ